MDKDVVNTYNGILLSHKKEAAIFAICSNTGGLYRVLYWKMVRPKKENKYWMISLIWI